MVRTKKFELQHGIKELTRDNNIIGSKLIRDEEDNMENEEIKDVDIIEEKEVENEETVKNDKDEKKEEKEDMAKTEKTLNADRLFPYSSLKKSDVKSEKVVINYILKTIKEDKTLRETLCLYKLTGLVFSSLDTVTNLYHQSIGPFEDVIEKINKALGLNISKSSKSLFTMRKDLLEETSEENLRQQHQGHEDDIYFDPEMKLEIEGVKTSDLNKVKKEIYSEVDKIMSERKPEKDVIEEINEEKQEAEKQEKQEAEKQEVTTTNEISTVEIIKEYRETIYRYYDKDLTEEKLEIIEKEIDAVRISASNKFKDLSDNFKFINTEFIKKCKASIKINNENNEEEVIGNSRTNDCDPKEKSEQKDSVSETHKRELTKFVIDLIKVLENSNMKNLIQYVKMIGYDNKTIAELNTEFSNILTMPISSNDIYMCVNSSIDRFNNNKFDIGNLGEKIAASIIAKNNGGKEFNNMVCQAIYENVYNDFVRDRVQEDKKEMIELLQKADRKILMEMFMQTPFANKIELNEKDQSYYFRVQKDKLYQINENNTKEIIKSILTNAELMKAFYEFSFKMCNEL